VSEPIKERKHDGKYQHERHDDPAERPVVPEGHSSEEQRQSETEQKQSDADIEIGIEDRDERNAEDDQNLRERRHPMKDRVALLE
jgi:hypothetical protein